MSTLGQAGPTRRSAVTGFGAAALAAGCVSAPPPTGTASRVVTVNARPGPIEIDLARTAVVVVDMQNDFGAKGGMFERAGIDISPIIKAVGPTAQTLAAARVAGLKIVYLKMGFKPDLSDLGSPASVNRGRHMLLNVGQKVVDPNGRESRILVRDTWNTEIVPELAPAEDDVVIYKTRFSGFYQTNLHEILQRWGVSDLIVTGCTTSICVDSTVRDAMFRDYRSVVLSDCMGEPIGNDLPRSNHEASLLAIEVLLGWVASSRQFIEALEAA